jgi:predicted PurR-regulated permease PerM
VHLTLKSYIRAKAILGGLSALFYSTSLLLLRFPHAIALALIGGVLEFIPVAGWITTAAVIVSVGVLTHFHWIWMAVLLGIWRMLQDYYTSPRVMGHELEIHPLMTIFAVMVGWQVGGIAGIYLLVPVIAATRAVWRGTMKSSSQAQAELILVNDSSDDSRAG